MPAAARPSLNASCSGGARCASSSGVWGGRVPSGRRGASWPLKEGVAKATKHWVPSSLERPCRGWGKGGEAEGRGATGGRRGRVGGEGREEGVCGAGGGIFVGVGEKKAGAGVWEARGAA